MASFDLAFRITLSNEDTHPSGKIDIDNNDYRVRFGINEAYYPHSSVFSEDMPEALETAKSLYKDIWDSSHLDLIANDAIAAKVFDLEFNCGTISGVEILQKSINALGVNVGVDGRLGPLTAAAANALDPKTLMAKIVQVGIFHYEEVVANKPRYASDLPGWEARLRKHTEIA